MSQANFTPRSLRSLLLIGAASTVFGVGTPAFAQDEAPAASGDTTEDVTVTGTRIRQRDFETTSPIATVSAEEIALTGTINVEELINSLPQIIPGVTITSNNPSLNGFATADLRGLGPGRTLILINGRRANPSSAGGAVDLNTIPASLIERIEVLTGGASAVYGADAVAGAINFILKEDFEGIEGGLSYGQAEDGVMPEWTANALMGGTFAGDKGSIQLGLQYYNRQKVDATERDFSRYAAPVLFDGTNTKVSFTTDDFGLGFSSIFSGGSASAPWGSIGGFSAANVNAIYGGPVLDADCNPFNGVNPTGGTIRFRAGGGISPFQSCAHPNFTDGTVDEDGDRYNFAPDNFLILANERINASTFAQYEILPGGELTAFVDAMFTNSRSVQQLAATPRFGQVVKYDLDPAVGSVVLNPYVEAQTEFRDLALLQFGGLAGLDNRNFSLTFRTTQVGNRVGTIETNAFSSTQGLRGNLAFIDWDWEIYHSYARNETTVQNDNNIGATALTQLLNACNTTTTAPQTAPAGALPNCPFPYNSAAGGAFIPTPTENNPLGFFALSDDMINFIRVNTTDVITYERTLISGFATGDVIDPFGQGPIAAAVGFEYRTEELSNRVDSFKNSGDIIGFNAQKSISGQYDVYEAFAEVSIPLLSGHDFVHYLGLEGGYRFSDYSTGAGTTETYKYGAEFAPVEWLTFRGIFNRAVRAPTAFELFRAGDQNFPAYVDPCDKDTFSGTDASCTAWFAAFGAVFVPGAFDQPNSQVQAFLFGNPNLSPEVSDTLTYGVVFNPEWWPIGQIGLSVDRYDIEIGNQIGQRAIATILNGCRDAIIANGNVFPVGNEFCDVVVRDPLADGAVGSIDQSLANFPGLSEYSGIDVNLRWSWDWEDDLGIPGTFGVASLYSWVDEADGSQGFYVGSVGGVIPIHKVATTFTYDVGDFSFLLRWSWLDEVEDGVFGLGTIVPSYELFDFGGRWDVTSELAVSFNIDNIADEQPPVWDGANAAGQFNTDGSTYDSIGRRFRIGVVWQN